MTLQEQIVSARTALESACSPKAAQPIAFVGLDGFIDEIVQVVDTRQDHEHFKPIQTISEYAARLAQAAGKSTNVEFVLQQVKMGGNGPLMGDAMGRLGVRLQYVGAVGHPIANSTFECLKKHGEVLAIGNPGVTVAAEFQDGKIMHGRLESLNEITYTNVLDRMGGPEVLDELFAAADMMALVNWTMIPHATDIWRRFLKHLKRLGDMAPQLYFFDLCDPQKRTRDDLREALRVIASFNEAAGMPILGLNDKESAEVCDAVGVDYGNADHAGMLERAHRLVVATSIPEIVIHPTHAAAAIGPAGHGAVDGPLCKNPKLTTGAGDHFNGGYCYARLMGLPPQQAVVIGKATSGFYVREGRGPSREEILTFLRRWADNRLDPWQGAGTA
ncbi:carbohydrate kinase family protein [Candidatus Poribacteria bacterium]|nr:carbohydrate kinase family protein [Candidatus Poribacteria bacterium]